MMITNYKLGQMHFPINTRLWLFFIFVSAFFHLLLLFVPSIGSSVNMAKGDTSTESSRLMLKAHFSKKKLQSPSKAPINEPKDPSTTEQSSSTDLDSTNESAEKSKSIFNLEMYAAQVRRAILRHKRYPVIARRMQLSGLVNVSVSINKKGNIVKVPSIVKSSGYALLDKEALRMVNAAAPFDTLPVEFKNEYLAILIPVEFDLRDL